MVMLMLAVLLPPLSVSHAGSGSGIGRKQCKRASERIHAHAHTHPLATCWMYFSPCRTFDSCPTLEELISLQREGKCVRLPGQALTTNPPPFLEVEDSGFYYMAGRGNAKVVVVVVVVCALPLSTV